MFEDCEGYRAYFSTKKKLNNFIKQWIEEVWVAGCWEDAETAKNNYTIHEIPINLPFDDWCEQS